MNHNLKCLIESVANNDLQKAKTLAKAIIDADNTTSNRYFVMNIKNKLSVPAMNLLELPHNVKALLTVEDTSLSFNAKRYVLADEDSETVSQILNTHKINEKLTELGIHYLNSTLLYGESGCGKTMLGRYISWKVGLPFAYLNFSHLVSSYLGTTGKNIAEVFEFISNGKYVFMLDELDAIGLKRGSEDVGEMARIVITLMQCLDNLQNGTIVIGATNREDIIDPALKRRFTINHKMELPTNETIRRIVEKFIKTIPGAEVDYAAINTFAYNNSGKSCAAIVNLLIQRIVECLTDNKPITLF